MIHDYEKDKILFVNNKKLFQELKYVGLVSDFGTLKINRKRLLPGKWNCKYINYFIKITGYCTLSNRVAINSKRIVKTIADFQEILGTNNLFHYRIIKSLIKDNLIIEKEGYFYINPVYYSIHDFITERAALLFKEELIEKDMIHDMSVSYLERERSIKELEQIKYNGSVSTWKISTNYQE